MGFWKKLFETSEETEERRKKEEQEELDSYLEDCCGECGMPSHACQCPPSGSGPCGGGSRGWGIGS